MAVLVVIIIVSFASMHGRLIYTRPSHFRLSSLFVSLFNSEDARTGRIYAGWKHHSAAEPSEKAIRYKRTHITQLPYNLWISGLLFASHTGSFVCY